MLSRQEYEQVIRTFLVELNYLCAEVTPPQLQAIPQFEKEIASYLADLQDPTNDAAQTLRTAFAFVDEYVGADWHKVVETGYNAYALSQRPDLKRE